MSTPKHVLSEPLTLRCGLTLPNRLVKAAMAENEVGRDMLPNDALVKSYGPWADGGWGMIVTGDDSIALVDAQHSGFLCVTRS